MSTRETDPQNRNEGDETQDASKDDRPPLPPDRTNLLSDECDSATGDQSETIAVDDAEWSPDSTHVEFYVRSGGPCPHRRKYLTRQLRKLERLDHIGSFSIKTWPAAVSLQQYDDDVHEWILERIRKFEQWAARNNFTLDPPFQVRETHCSITEESQTRLVLPTFGLAVYNGHELVAVAPCRGSDEPISIDDVLDSLTEDKTFVEVTA